MLAYPAIAREIAADPGDRRENAARGETTRTVAGSTMLNVNPLLANDYISNFCDHFLLYMVHVNT